MSSVPYELFAHCDLCFHRCNCNRAIGKKGRCHLDAGLYVESVARHLGEEPVIGGKKGVCNVFFNHCNLQCVFCQNWQISANSRSLPKTTLGEVVEKIEKELKDGCTAVGFVSPTPYIPYVIDIVSQLHVHGYKPTIVYNTNAYDTPAALETLAGYVDIYLPDYKYANALLGLQYSGIQNYPEYALESIACMLQQVGVTLEYNREGLLERGVIVRHLVLPNQVENSRSALFNLWSEFGSNLTISLMSQYTPLHLAGRDINLARRISEDEYRQVVDFMFDLGFSNGWIQEIASSGNYVPDFEQEHPFEN